MDSRRALLESLQPYIDKANAQCHPKVQLSVERIMFTRKDKQLVRTLKGSVTRAQSLQLYEPEIAALFESQARD